MKTRLDLYARFLSYEPDIVLHTALSGRVAGISSIYLTISRDDGFFGVSETRANMTYYNGLAEDAVPGELRRAIARIRWDRPIDAILEDLETPDLALHPVARCALEGALLDGKARAAGVSVAALLGGVWRPRVVSNNSLMWSAPEIFERLANRFVAEGFRTLKIRIAVADFETDLQRIKYVVDRFGTAGVTVGVDVNCRWGLDEAIAKIKRLADLGIAFVEQPTAPDDHAALTVLKRETPIPIVLDEGCQTLADVERVRQLGPPFKVHLKMLKIGGPSNMVRAARRLSSTGVEPIFGQMNEGMAATALAAQCAMIQPADSVTELYGFYGLRDEPVAGPRYENGCIVFADPIGTGFAFDPAGARHIGAMLE